MNVHHLELFYYVAKFEGITAAVRKMPYGIQQPAVSGQILQLEDSLGVKLFNRRPFSLTPAGDELYDFIYPFFSKLPQVEEKLKGEESKHLRIAASAAVMRNHMPQVLADLQNSISNLKITLKEVEPAEVFSCIVSQQIDIAITTLHGNLSDGVAADELLSLEIVILVPADWEVDSFEDLLEENPEGKGHIIDKPLIGLPEHEIANKIFDKSLVSQNIQWPVTIEVNSLTIKTLPLPDMPPLVVGAIYQGKPKPIAQAFLDAIKVKAKLLSSME